MKFQKPPFILLLIPLLQMYLPMKKVLLRLLFIFFICGLTTHFLYAQQGANCSDPFPIPVLPYSQSGFSTCGMGNDVTNGNSPCGPSLTGYNGEDMIFELTPSLSGCYRITGTASGSTLMITDACPTSGGANCISSAPSVLGFMQLDLSLDAGTTYYLTMASGSAGSCGDFGLAIDFIPSSVPNDACSTAQPVQGTGSNYGATACGEPNSWSPDPNGTICNPNNGSIWSSMENGVWYTFNNPTFQDTYMRVYNIECEGAGGDLQIGVWTDSGSCDLGLETFIGCAIGTGDITLPLNNLPAGNYYLFLDGDGGSQCTWYFDSDIVDPPACDACNGGTPPANDICLTGAEDLGTLPSPGNCVPGASGVIYGASLTIPGSNICATQSVPYPSGGGSCTGGTQANPAADVWYEFTASATNLNALLQSTGFSLTNPNIALYDGPTCPAGAPLACEVGTGGAVFFEYTELVPGNTYFIQVSGSNVNDQCEFNLVIRNDNDCRNCVSSSFMSSVTPAPTGGQFSPGTTVEFCYTVDEYTTVDGNALHGIVPVLGSGWDASSLTAGSTPPTTCAALSQGVWMWDQHPTHGPGWFFDRGFLIFPPDGNPFNNAGDSDALGICQWTFCWEVTANADCNSGSDLSITVENYSDGETGTGGGTSSSCEEDLDFIYSATLDCASCTNPTISVSDITEPCQGESTGAIDLTITPSGSYTYTWGGGPSPIGDLQDPTGILAGTYTVTVSDGMGCSSSQSITVNENTPPIISVTSLTQPSCAQPTGGAINISISDGQTPYDIDWDNNGTGQTNDPEDLTNLSGGAYNITVTDANGCSAIFGTALTTPVCNTCELSNPQATPVCGAPCAGTPSGDYFLLVEFDNMDEGANGVDIYVDGTPLATGQSYGLGSTQVCVDAASFTANGETDIEVIISDADADPPAQLAGMAGNCTGCFDNQSGLMINEVSHGAAGNQDWFELLVTGGTNLNPDGWVIDDNNGSFDGSGATSGYLFFNLSNDPSCDALSSLPPGALVLIYNEDETAVGIPPDDPFDANQDGVYVIPHNHTCLNLCDDNIIPCTNIAASSLWNTQVGMAMAGDAAQTLAPDGSFFSGISWGTAGASTSPPGSVHFSSTANTYEFHCGDANIASNWGTQASSASSTPGTGANTDNQAVINLLNGGNLCFACTNYSEPAAPLDISETHTDLDCFGDTDGAINLTITGGTPTYLIDWDNDGTGDNDDPEDLSSLGGGTYNVTVTDANGCSETLSVEIVEPTEIIPDITGATSTCSGADVELDAGAYDQYAWNDAGSSTTQTITVSSTADAQYCVTVTDTDGCTGTACHDITINPDLTPSIAGDAAACSGADVELDAGAYDQYAWNDAGSSTTQTITVSSTADAQYCVTVTDTDGCTGEDCHDITINPDLTPSIAGDAAACSGADVELDAGAYDQYAWNDAGSSTTQTITVSSTADAQYCVTVTDTDGCTGEDCHDITINPDLTPSIAGDAAACSGADVELDAGAYDQYAWNDAGSSTTQTITVSPTADAQYCVTVTDTDGCTGEDCHDITINPDLTPSIAGDAAACSGADVELDAGAYDQYAWNDAGSSTTQTITVSSTADAQYCVTVTDTDGCTGTACHDITINPDLTPSIAGDAAACSGADVELDAGAYDQYAWNDAGSSTTQTITVSPTADAQYCVTVTDTDGCTGEDCHDITINPNLSPNITGDATACSGADVELDAGAYDQYAWNDAGSSTTQTITVSSTADAQYCVTVTDTDGCTGEDCHDITINPDLTPSIAGDAAACSGADVELDAGAYDQYAWNDAGSSTTQTITVSSTADAQYCVTVTDTDGCTGEDCHDITINPNITFDISGPTSTCSGSDITLDAGLYDAYSWDDGSTTQTITDAPTTDVQYCVTVTDANGCTGEDCHDVTIDPNITFDISGPTSTCSGSSVTLDAGLYDEYLWDDGSTTQTITDAPTNDVQYCVTVTDANGCTGEDCHDVTIDPNITFDVSGPASTCSGSSVTLDAGLYDEYSWGTGATTQTVTDAPTADAQYCVTVTDTNGCTGEDCHDVTIDPNITFDISGPTSTCSGSDITLDAGLYDEYSWDDGSTTQTITDAPTADVQYCVTVTDANGCTGEDCHDVTISPNVVFEITGPTSTCSGSSVTLDAGVYDAYSWDDGSTTQTITDAPTTASQYCVTVTDANGCTGEDCHDVTIDPDITFDISGPTSTCSGSDITLDAGLYDAYSWDDGSTTQTITDAPTTASQYCVTVTDANGCTGEDCHDVTIDPDITFDISGPTSTCSGSDITLDAGLYDEYLWDNGSTTQTITDAPTNDVQYCVTVTDANGCTGEDCHDVTIDPDITFDISGPTSTCSGSDITLDAGLYDAYSWDDGSTTQTITDAPTTASQYCVTVTDANGCTGEDCHDVTIDPDITFDISGPTSTCSGSDITLDAGLYDEYLWDDGSTTQTITDAPTNDVQYCVTVTDANGCTGEDCHDVTISPNVVFEITGPTSTCSGSSITLDAGLYDEYLWDDGATAQTITDAPTTASQYCVTVTDANGCTGEDCHDVTIDPDITFDISGPTSTCSGSDITLDAGLYDEYLWDDGATTQTITDAPTADVQYCVTVTDANGCTGEDCHDVTISPNVVFEISGPTSTCSGSDITLDAGVYDAYSWDDGSTTQTITDAPTADVQYCVTVTDANGCTGEDCHDVTINPDLTPTISGSASFCAGSNTVLDAGAFAAYQWNDATSANTPSITVTAAGLYCVTVTDADGCTGEDCLDVSEDQNLNPNIVGDLSVCEGSPGVLDAGAFDQYLWDDAGSGTTQTITVSPTADTQYCVTVTDATGCTGSVCETVTIDPNVVFEITGPTSTCSGSDITLDAGLYDEYLWDNGSTTQTITDAPTNDVQYCVTVTDANGCTGEDCHDVTIDPNITFDISGPTSTCSGSDITLDAGVYDAYSWDDGSTTQTITDAPTTDVQYCVTVTDANGCTGEDCHDVTIDPNITFDISGPTSTCSGSDIALDAGVYDAYSWDDGSTTQTITDAPTTDVQYCVTVTDANGCTGEDCHDVTISPNVVFEISGPTSTCSGSDIALDAGLYDEYLWDDGSTTQTITDAPTTDVQYCVTVTDANGCTGEDCHDVTINPDLTPTISGSASFCAGSNTVLDAGAFAAYQWNDATSANTPSITVTAAGLYCVTVTDADGCTGEDCLDVSEDQNLNPNIVGDLSVCEGSPGVLDAGAFDQYLWDDAGSGTAQTITVSPTADTQYCVTVTDATGCTGSVCETVTIDPNVVFEITGPTSTCSGSDIALDAGVYDEYLWDDGATTQTITDAPTTDVQYCVTVTDANGCTGEDCHDVTIDPDITFDISGPTSTCSGSDITLDAGVYDAYSWDDGSTTQTVTNAPTADAQYCVTVTDANGCTGEDCHDVTIDPDITFDISGPTSTCSGSDITLDASLYDAYSWDDGSTTQTITDAPTTASQYCVTVTDANGCTGEDCHDVTIDPDITFDISGPASTCSGSDITLDAGLYDEYLWDDGATTQMITDAPTTDVQYCVTVTDANGCTGEDCHDVTIDPNITFDISGLTSTCSGSDITLDAGVYDEYLWDDGATTQTITDAPTTNAQYCVTVTDANGCTGEDCHDVTIDPDITFDISGPASTCSGSDITLDAGVYDEYLWDDGATTQTITDAPTNDVQYCVTVTDANGCTGEDCHDVTISPNVVFEISGPTSTCSGSDITLDAGVYDAYSWDDGSTTQTITDAPTTDVQYCVTVTDANGCTGEDCHDVTIDPDITFDISGPDLDLLGFGHYLGCGRLRCLFMGRRFDHANHYRCAHDRCAILRDGDGCQRLHRRGLP